MTAYVTITNDQVDQDSPVTTPLLTALRDNPSAIAEGHADAPRIKPQILHVRDEKAANTAGGAAPSPAGVYFARTLNTILTNNITGASLASSRINLPAGEYEIDAVVPGQNVSAFGTLLYNFTAGTELLQGTNCQAASQMVHSFIRGRFTLAAAAALEVRMAVSASAGASDLGSAKNFGGRNEVYTDVIITRVGA